MSAAGGLDVYCFDPLATAWSLVRPANDSSPPNRQGFEIAAISNRQGSTLWMFGGTSLDGK